MPQEVPAPQGPAFTLAADDRRAEPALESMQTVRGIVGIVRVGGDAAEVVRLEPRGGEIHHRVRVKPGRSPDRVARLGRSAHHVEGVSRGGADQDRGQQHVLVKRCAGPHRSTAADLRGVPRGGREVGAERKAALRRPLDHGGRYRVQCPGGMFAGQFPQGPSLPIAAADGPAMIAVRRPVALAAYVGEGHDIFPPVRSRRGAEDAAGVEAVAPQLGKAECAERAHELAVDGGAIGPGTERGRAGEVGVPRPAAQPAAGRDAEGDRPDALRVMPAAIERFPEWRADAESRGGMEEAGVEPRDQVAPVAGGFVIEMPAVCGVGRSGSRHAGARDKFRALSAIGGSRGSALATVVAMSRPSREMDRSLLRGLAWTGAIRWGSQLLSWGGTVIVARLLSPSDYGLAGMAAIYTGFTQLLCEAGLSAALLRRRDEDPVARAQLGGFAALLGIVCCVLSMLAAIPLAAFFGQPAVREVVMVSSLGFVTRGMQVLPRALMARELDFRRLAWIDGAEATAMSVATLGLAVGGAGVWALVLGNLSGGLIGAVLSFWWRPVRLEWPRQVGAIASDVVFGGKVLGAQLSWYAYSNADFTMIGRMLGARALGTYTLAWTLANLPVDRISSIVVRVIPAYFASLSHDRPELRRQLLRVSEGLAMITFPACIGLALVAPDLVSVVLGPTWRLAVAPLQVLAVIAAMRSVFVLAAPILVFTGQVQQNLWYNVLLMLILPAAFGFASRWGILAVALVWILVYPFFASIFLFRHALRAVHVTWAAYLGALRVPLTATAVMAAAVWGFHLPAVRLHSGVIHLVAEVATGALVYTAMTLLLAGRRVGAIISLLRGTAPPPDEEGAHEPPPPSPRRLILVSWHFPPDPAVGGLRWQKLARFAHERGWSVDVVTRDPGGLTHADGERVADLPTGIRRHPVAVPPVGLADLPVRVWTRFRSRPTVTTNGGRAPGVVSVESIPSRLLSWWPRHVRDLGRHYFAWRERRIGRAWGAAAAREVRELLRERSADAIVSCGPPHPPHVAIAREADRAGIPFVLDLRDPWSLLQRIPEAVASPLGRALARIDERAAIDTAALVVVTSDRHRDALRAVHPARAGRIITVRNGSDDDPLPAPSPGEKFVIGYAGSVYLDRDPSALFRAAGRLIRERQLTPDRFGIEFMGHVRTHDGVSLEEIARREGVADHLALHPPAPRTAAFAFLARTSLLVLLPQDSDYAIPAKLFEYVRFPAWILALTAPESAMGEVLRGTSARLVPPDDAQGIYLALRDAFEAHLRGDHPVPVEQERPLHRRYEARVLFEALERLDDEQATRFAAVEGQVA